MLIRSPCLTDLMTTVKPSAADDLSHLISIIIITAAYRRPAVVI